MSKGAEYQRQWRLKNHEHHLAYSRQYGAKHRSEIRRKTKEAYHILRDKIFEKYGRRCNNPACQWLNSDGSRGCTEVLCLQIDHVNNTGYLDRRGAINWLTFYRKVLLDQTNAYQLLCANCNWIKKGKLQT